MLTKGETETQINYNDEEKVCQLYTCNKAMIRKMDRYCVEMPDIYKLMAGDNDSRTYEFPKKLVAVKKPIKKKEYTDEQREKMRSDFKARINASKSL